MDVDDNLIIEISLSELINLMAFNETGGHFQYYDKCENDHITLYFSENNSNQTTETLFLPCKEKERLL